MCGKARIRARSVGTKVLMLKLQTLLCIVICHCKELGGNRVTWFAQTSLENSLVPLSLATQCFSQLTRETMEKL